MFSYSFLYSVISSWKFSISTIDRHDEGQVGVEIAKLYNEALCIDEDIDLPCGLYELREGELVYVPREEDGDIEHEDISEKDFSPDESEYEPCDENSETD